MEQSTNQSTPSTPRKPWNDRNKNEYTGRLAAAPKINQKGDTIVVSGTIYVTNEFVDKKGEIAKHEARISFVSYGQKALEFAQAAGKGDRVELHGKMQGNSWVDKNEQKRYGLELVAFEPKVISKYVKKEDNVAA